MEVNIIFEKSLSRVDSGNVSTERINILKI